MHNHLTGSNFKTRVKEMGESIEYLHSSIRTRVQLLYTHSKSPLLLIPGQGRQRQAEFWCLLTIKPIISEPPSQGKILSQKTKWPTPRSNGAQCCSVTSMHGHTCTCMYIHEHRCIHTHQFKPPFETTGYKAGSLQSGHTTPSSWDQV